MLHPGLVSAAFKKLSPLEIIGLVKQAGLRGIEWNGDGHVSPGDLGCAREVRELSTEAGLTVAGYGSYYRAGQSETAGGVAFERVLETAVELGAPVLRVWAGTAASDATSDEARWKIIEDLRRIADLAARSLVAVSVEFYRGTLTDTEESTNQLLVEVDRPNFLAHWQPLPDEDTATGLAGLRALLPRLGNVHVWQGGPTEKDRRPLSEGAERWTAFLEAIHDAPGNRYALLKFVAGDSADAFLRDAATLKSWIASRPSTIAN